MSKILTTQLTGLFQRIQSTEEDKIGDAARLLAQAGIGEGNVYFACFGELTAVELHALHGVQPFNKLLPWSDKVELTEADRVCIFTPSAFDKEAIALAKRLFDDFIPFAVVTSEKEEAEGNELAELAYVYVSLKIRGGILPHPTNLGERIVFPHLIATLYVYEAIKMEYDEMVGEEEDDLSDSSGSDLPSFEEMHGGNSGGSNSGGSPFA